MPSNGTFSLQSCVPYLGELESDIEGNFGSFSNSLATRTISFPEDELEELLRLVQILQNKIIHIDNSIGLDQIIAGDQIHPKVFEIIRRIISKDERLFEELESSAFGGRREVLST
jgi:hypothetical protein